MRPWSCDKLVESGRNNEVHWSGIVLGLQASFDCALQIPPILTKFRFHVIVHPVCSHRWMRRHHGFGSALISCWKNSTTGVKNFLNVPTWIELSQRVHNENCKVLSNPVWNNVRVTPALPRTEHLSHRAIQPLHLQDSAG
jgi:hypothetical protein